MQIVIVKIYNTLIWKTFQSMQSLIMIYINSDFYKVISVSRSLIHTGCLWKIQTWNSTGAETTGTTLFVALLQDFIHTIQAQ